MKYCIKLDQDNEYYVTIHNNDDVNTRFFDTLGQLAYEASKLDNPEDLLTVGYYADNDDKVIVVLESLEDLPNLKEKYPEAFV